MDPTTFWSAIGILASASGGGFLFLSSRHTNSSKEIDRLKIQVEGRPTYKEVADDYVRKEVIDLQIRHIEKDIALILDKVRELKSNEQTYSKD